MTWRQTLDRRAEGWYIFHRKQRFPFTTDEVKWLSLEDFPLWGVRCRRLLSADIFHSEGSLKELIINERIRDREVRLIGEDGTQYGIIPISEARRIAEEKGLDICKVSPPDVTPATCKLMDYGKYRYDQQKREKEQRKNQRIVELKEVRLSATIDVGDTKRLAAQTAKFISEGNKVKASIRLKGRQQAHPEIAVGIIKDYIEMVGEGAVVEKAPVQEGRMIYTILAPQNKK